MRPVLLLLLVPLASCATRWNGDPDLYGLALDVELTQHHAPWAQRDDLRPRARAVVAQAAAYWGVAPEDLAGWRVLLTEGLIRCGGHEGADGCTTSDDSTMAVTANFVVCVESSALLHELGHAALGGDPDHHDQRWHDTAALAAIWDQLHAGLPDAPDCGGEPYQGQWQGF